MLDEAAAVAARDDGEVFPTHTIGYDVAPSRQPRLRLRPMKDDEYDAAASAVGHEYNALVGHLHRITFFAREAT
ncbi:hypothetical protein ATCC90586_012000 [Pythium insidiosum]|nr:hypothetical protein ATCC90586_012000 [Pythium insidiosum]